MCLLWNSNNILVSPIGCTAVAVLISSGDYMVRRNHIRKWPVFVELMLIWWKNNCSPTTASVAPQGSFPFPRYITKINQHRRSVIVRTAGNQSQPHHRTSLKLCCGRIGRSASMSGNKTTCGKRHFSVQGSPTRTPTRFMQCPVTCGMQANRLKCRGPKSTSIKKNCPILSGCNTLVCRRCEKFQRCWNQRSFVHGRWTEERFGAVSSSEEPWSSCDGYKRLSRGFRGLLICTQIRSNLFICHCWTTQTWHW